MTDMDPQEIAIAALGDQVQAILTNSTYDVAIMVLVAADGGVEIRSQLSYDDTKAVLHELAEGF